jgi:hypothetical protein
MIETSYCLLISTFDQLKPTPTILAMFSAIWKRNSTESPLASCKQFVNPFCKQNDQEKGLTNICTYRKQILLWLTILKSKNFIILLLIWTVQSMANIWLLLWLPIIFC